MGIGSKPNLRNTKGQGLAEYIIIVIVVAIVIIVAIKYFGGSIFGKFESATQEIGNLTTKDTSQSPPDIPVASEVKQSSSATSDNSNSQAVLATKEQNPVNTSGGSSSSELDSKVANLATKVGEDDNLRFKDVKIDLNQLYLLFGAIIMLGIAVLFVKSRKTKGKKSPKSIFKKNQDGQVLVLGLFVCVGLFMIAISVANIGMVVAEKIHLQDTADASAYSAAVTQARYMNLSAYINRSMIANYDAMAFNTSLWATADADDHGIAIVTSMLYKVDAVLAAFIVTLPLAQDLDQILDGLRDNVHKPLHDLNHNLNEMFAQDEDSKWNGLIETYNIDILATYQGLMYAAMQSSRHEVIEKVAAKMDKDVKTNTVLGLAAEAVSYEELASAVDFLIRDTDSRKQPFKSLYQAYDKMAGKEENNEDDNRYLAAVTEASLDRFAAGRTRDGEDDLLRQFKFDHIVPFGPIESALDFECNIEEQIRSKSPLALFTDPLNCNADFNFGIGAEMRSGYENKASQAHVPAIARRRMREENFFGLNFKVSGLDGVLGSSVYQAVKGLQGEWGHISGEKHNDVGNVANTTLFDVVSPERALETLMYYNFQTCPIGTPIPSCGLNSQNIIEASGMLVIPPIAVDDHWDGSFDDIYPVYETELFPPGKGLVESGRYTIKAASEGELEEGVPKYD
ncbi:MAG: Tad domain-containing protein, partial [Proteobacteria bacterium]|nr:Tad domain-containing protein [Pseudomonadota bacterium]